MGVLRDTVGNFVREADRERHPEMHNAAQAEYNRSAALIRCRALKFPGFIW
jgi:hypothetical protein